MFPADERKWSLLCPSKISCLPKPSWYSHLLLPHGLGGSKHIFINKITMPSHLCGLLTNDVIISSVCSTAKVQRKEVRLVIKMQGLSTKYYCNWRWKVFLRWHTRWSLKGTQLMMERWSSPKSQKGTQLLGWCWKEEALLGLVSRLPIEGSQHLQQAGWSLEK